MKREVFEPFPKVERIVEFSEEDIRENTCVTSVDESLITDKNWQEFADNALVLLPAILYISMLKSSQSLYIVVVKMQWLCLKADSILLLGVSRFLRQTAESVFHLIRGTWNGNTQDLIPWHILQKYWRTH